MWHLALVIIIFFVSLRLEVRSTDNLIASEQEAIDLGKRIVQKRLEQPHKKRSWLCAAFMKGNATELDIVLKNARVLPCDWIVVFYSHSVELRQIQTQICDGLKAFTRVRRCRATKFNATKYLELVDEYTSEPPKKKIMYSHDANYIKKLSQVSISESSGNLFIPKQVMYQELLPYLKDYESVLMMDSDMLFANKDFNFMDAQAVWQKGYEQPLLLAQPTVQGNAEFEVFTQMRWGSQAHVAIGIEYIEQQVYFVNSMLLEWMIRAFLVAKTIDYHFMYLSDWGYDSVMCLAAKAFSASVLNRPIDIRQKNPVCAILTHQTVIHVDTKTIPKSAYYRKSGHVLKDIYRELYPHWYFDTLRLQPESQGVVHWDALAQPIK